MWPFRRAGTADSADQAAAQDVTKCRRCGRVIEVDLAMSVGALEGMHWLCFHLEYEHDTDPDLPCTDFAGCPWWTIRHYERRLRELGLDPRRVLFEEMEREVDAE